MNFQQLYQSQHLEQDTLEHNFIPPQSLSLNWNLDDTAQTMDNQETILNQFEQIQRQFQEIKLNDCSYQQLLSIQQTFINKQNQFILQNLGQLNNQNRGLILCKFGASSKKITKAKSKRKIQVDVFVDTVEKYDLNLKAMQAYQIAQKQIKDLYTLSELQEKKYKKQQEEEE